MKYIKVTPPDGNAVVIPDNEANRRHFERLNELHAAEKDDKRYKIEEAKEADVRLFNPELEKKPITKTQSVEDTVKGVLAAEKLKEKEAELEAMKAKLEAAKEKEAELEAMKAELEKMKKESEEAKASAKK